MYTARLLGRGGSTSIAFAYTYAYFVSAQVLVLLEAIISKLGLNDSQLYGFTQEQLAPSIVSLIFIVVLFEIVSMFAYRMYFRHKPLTNSAINGVNLFYGFYIAFIALTYVSRIIDYPRYLVLGLQDSYGYSETTFMGELLPPVILIIISSVIGLGMWRVLLRLSVDAKIK